MNSKKRLKWLIEPFFAIIKAMSQIPKALLKTKYRREMWKQSQEIVKKLTEVLPITSVHVLGSFTTKKERPADVDFIVFCKTKEKKKSAKWSADITIAPDNDYGKFVLEDADKWVKEKYGLKKSTTIRII